MSGQRRLNVVHCERCDVALAPHTRTCSECGGIRLDIEPCGGRATVISWRTVISPDDHSREVLPETLAIVELDEGPWLSVFVVGDLPTDGESPVRVAFECMTHGKRYPIFSVCDDSDSAGSS